MAKVIMKILLKNYTKMERFVNEIFHTPVMLKELIDFFFLPPQQVINKYFPQKKIIIEKKKETPQIFVDATAGGGGHLFSLINYYQKNFPQNFCDTIFVGIDIDKEAIIYLEEKKKRFNFDNLFIYWDNYVNIKKLFEREHFEKRPSRILFDLGISYYQAKNSERGFSFTVEGKIDMRFDQIRKKMTALDIIKKANLKKLKKILKEFSEDPKAAQIATKIFYKKKTIHTTYDLKKIILACGGKESIPRIFQALRIATNDELENLKIGLKEAFWLLNDGGRLAVISYHSLEDKIVKRYFKMWKEENKGVILTPKPVTPSSLEIENNLCARSGRLRVFLKYEKN
uniref:Ribosomal RNA small subunit methyltransferase H n=1 Tax=candidate division WOR-3 bacterium TaxID=2052148 RepID=A0A7V3ZVZ3_UNCW3